jgi:hypothetical protein
MEAVTEAATVAVVATEVAMMEMMVAVTGSPMVMAKVDEKKEARAAMVTAMARVVVHRTAARCAASRLDAARKVE